MRCLFQAAYNSVDNKVSDHVVHQRYRRRHKDIRPSVFVPIYSQERVRQGYCPSLDEELLEDCEEHLAHSYVAMLNMIVQVNATFMVGVYKRALQKN